MNVASRCRVASALSIWLAACGSDSGVAGGGNEDTGALDLDSSAGDARHEDASDARADSSTSDTFGVIDSEVDATVDSEAGVDTLPSSDTTTATDAADGGDATPSCATCVKMNDDAFDFGSDYLQYVAQDSTTLYWVANAYASNLFSLPKSAVLQLPKSLIVGGTTAKRDLTFKDSALYWVNESSDTTFRTIGRFNLATLTADTVVVEYGAGSTPIDLAIADALLDDSTHGLAYVSHGSLFELPAGATPGPRGTATCAAGLYAVTGADALSFYGTTTGLVRVDRASCAKTMLDPTAHFRSHVLLVDATKIYYQEATSGRVEYVPVSATGPTTPTIVTAIPANALVTADSATSLSWAVSGAAGISRLDLSTGAVTTMSTGTIAVDFLVADATNEYFFSTHKGSTFRNPYDVYRVAKE